MKYIPLAIPDLVLMIPKVFQDDRGYFCETWREHDFVQHVGDYNFVQENKSKSVKWTLRGLHYQIRQPQGKLIQVSHGAVFDVAVDLRETSSTFGHWVGEILTGTNNKLLWIPPGFAHGFLVLSDEVIFSYKCTDYYSQENERCILWDDPQLGIKWHTEQFKPILSAKDQTGLLFKDAEVYR